MRAPCLAVFLSVMAACGGRPAPLVTPAPAAPVADVNALIAAGCYRCLDEAFGAASRSGNRTAAAEAALLLVLRAKEIGLPPDPWLQRAREYLPAGDDWAAYLDVVTVFPRDPLSDDRSVLQEEGLAQRRPLADYDAWRTRLTSGAGSAVMRSYLDLSIACRPDLRRPDFERVRGEAVEAVLAVHGTRVPLLQYLVGLCGGRSFDQLAEARQAEPRLVDAELELGRREVVRRPRPDIPEAFRRLGLAVEAFPDSPVARATLARLHEQREQWPEALAGWDAVIALVPRHGDALMGRTTTLSQMLRHEDAVAAATRTIEVAPSHRADAYYWRAWNQFRLTRHELARADADAAKALSVNAPLFLLSGLIEWELKRPETAESEFLEAIVVDAGYCEAASYLGGVRLELRKWPESLAAFQQAERCYELAIALRREAIRSLSATPEDATANAWEIGGHQRALAGAERRLAEALQNSAALQKFLGTR